MTPERLVIQRNPNGSVTFISRARLAGPDGVPTPAGEKFAATLAAVEGIDTALSRMGGVSGGYGTAVSLVHEALWSWDEVEPNVIDAYRQLLGVDDLDVIREDKTGRTEAPA